MYIHVLIALNIFINLYIFVHFQKIAKRSTLQPIVLAPVEKIK